MAAVFLRFGGNFAGETVNPKTVFAGVDSIYLKTIGGGIHTPPESAWGVKLRFNGALNRTPEQDRILSKKPSNSPFFCIFMIIFS